MAKIDNGRLEDVIKDLGLDGSDPDLASRLRAANQEPPTASVGGGAAAAPTAVDSDF